MSDKSLKHHVTLSDPYREYDVTVVTLSDCNAVVATATFESDAGSITATGSSKRAPGDPSGDSGELLAIGRALLALGEYFEAAGDELAPE